MRLSDARHSATRDMEDGVALDVSSFSSPDFSLLLYFVRSQPNTHGIGTNFYHLQRQVQSY